jgi:homoserine O-succinyltransferase
MAGFYEDAGFLEAANLDALIVTGGAPDEDYLRCEPYWMELAQLIDWAETGTISTLFSGLAASAAVLRMGGVTHHPLQKPLLGVYGSVRAEDDPLFFNSAQSVPVPHIRHYDLAESELRAAGYRVLSHLDTRKDGGSQVDIFTRDTPGRSRFVFLQGHPEQDPGVLARLHLQAMERFHAGTGERPALPENYFDRATEDRLSRVGDDLAAYRSVVTNALPRQVWWRLQKRGAWRRGRCPPAAAHKGVGGLASPGRFADIVLAQFQSAACGRADACRHVLVVEIQIVSPGLVPAGNVHGEKRGLGVRGQRTGAGIEVRQGLVEGLHRNAFGQAQFDHAIFIRGSLAILVDMPMEGHPAAVRVHGHFAGRIGQPLDDIAPGRRVAKLRQEIDPAFAIDLVGDESERLHQRMAFQCIRRHRGL